MLDTLKEVIANQFHAALCTLSECIDRCPDAAWHSKIVSYEFTAELADLLAAHASTPNTDTPA